jgi:ABC-type uncharacterized transport system involved in gliding motility auxiliary subunit
MADSRDFRSKFLFSSLTFLGVLFAILIAVQFLGPALSGVKLDLTKDKIFTISEPTKQILAGLKDDIIIRYYCSEDVPSFLMNLQRDTIDMFRELESLSGGRFKWEVIAPEVKAREFAKEKVKEYFEAKDKGLTPKEPAQKEGFEDLFFGGRKPKKGDDEIAAERRKKAELLAGRTKRSPDDVFKQLLTEEYTETYIGDLQKQGIYQIPVEEQTGQSRRETNFFTALEIKYLDKQPEVISVYHQIQNLEYELANKIVKLTQRSKPKVVFFDGRKPPMPEFNPMNPNQRPPMSEYAGVIQALSELFDIEEITLKDKGSITDVLKKIQDDLAKKDDGRPVEEKPDRISCLIVAQPNDLEDRQVYEISKAVSEGIPTIFLVSSYSLDISQQGIQTGIPITVLRPGLEDLFRSWGIVMGKDILGSRECSQIMVTQRRPDFPIPVQQRFQMPVLVRAVGDAISQRHALTNRIPALVFPATVGLNVNEDDAKKAELQVTELANSGKEAFNVTVNPFEPDMMGMNRMQGPSLGRYKELVDRRVHKEGFISPPKALGVYMEGSFPFKYQDGPIPEWEPEPKKEEGAGGPGMPGMPPGMIMPGMDDPDGPRGPRGPSEGEDPAAAPAPAPVTSTAAPAPAAAPPAPTQDPAPVAPPPAPAAPAAAQPAAPAPADSLAPAPAVPAAAAPAPAAPAAPAPGATPPAPAAGEKAAEKPAEKKEPEKVHIELKKGRVMILSSADMMKTQFLAMQGDYEHNLNFFSSTIESFGLDERLMNIRRKELTEKRFKPGTDETSSRVIQIVNMGVLPLLVGAFGLVRFLIRRADASRYERQYIPGARPGTGS